MDTCSIIWKCNYFMATHFHLAMDESILKFTYYVEKKNLSDQFQFEPHKHYRFYQSSGQRLQKIGSIAFRLDSSQMVCTLIVETQNNSKHAGSQWFTLIPPPPDPFSPQKSIQFILIAVQKRLVLEGATIVFHMSLYTQFQAGIVNGVVHLNGQHWTRCDHYFSN